MGKRVFSGIQPTGNIHIGNYLGAMRNHVALQAECDCIYCVVDLHAITTPQEPAVLRASIRQAAALLLATGIDPKKSRLFVQSDVSAHAELQWILTCHIPFGWLRRMTQFKDKSQEAGEQVSAGLFAYPSLMAADILLYDTDLVPVGEDQVQHLELTRDVAQRFNTMYGDTFKLPQRLLAATGARIMGLDDPTRKMSKSETAPGHAVYLLDPPDEVRAKMMRATTDSLREVRFDEARPGVNNLLTIYEAFTGEAREQIEQRFAGKGYADLKKAAAEVIIEGLQPMQERYRQLAADPTGLDALLREGADRVRPLAEAKLTLVRERLGLG